MKLSQRAQRIEPFYVMEMGKTAALLAQQFAHTDRPMIALNIGEPDFTAPPLVQAAAHQAIQDGQTQYTHALGLQALRERISQWYAKRWDLAVAPERIVVTAGASAALHLACMALVDEGDEILLPDPSYPCNRQFVQAAGGRAVLLPTSAAPQRVSPSNHQAKSAENRAWQANSTPLRRGPRRFMQANKAVSPMKMPIKPDKTKPATLGPSRLRH